MKRVLAILIASLVTAQAYAQTVANDLIGLGMPAEQADYLAGILPSGSVLGNNTYLKGRNAANSADISILKVDGTDDTFLNADSGDIIKFAVAGTPVASMDSTTFRIQGTTTTSAADFASIASSFTYINSGANNGLMHYGVASSSGTRLDFAKSRATDGSGDTIVQSGDDLGVLNFWGADGVDYAVAAQMLVESDGTPGSGDMPGRFVFSTTSDGGETLTEALRLDSSQMATFAKDAIFTAGQGPRLPSYVPTMAATPVAGTNVFKVGLNVVPTAAANTAALLDATPTPGNVYVIYNSGPNTIRIKGGGATTINGATAGGYVGLATLSSAVCRITSASNANCVLEVAPTPAGP